MTAPGPVPGANPWGLSYQAKQFDSWMGGGQEPSSSRTIFDTLANPPAAGVAAAEVPIYVPPEPKAPSITTSSLGDFTVEVPVNVTFRATGAQPITWSGSPPSPLELSEAGVLTGTPEEEGSYDFEVTATNEVGSDTKQYTGDIVEGVSPMFAPLGASLDLGGEEKTTTKEETTEEEEADLQSWTVAELKDALDDLEVDYPSGAKKAELIDLLEEAQNGGSSPP